MDGGFLGPKKIGVKSHVNWGHASAQQLKPALADSDADNMRLLTSLSEVFEL